MPGTYRVQFATLLGDIPIGEIQLSQVVFDVAISSAGSFQAQLGVADAEVGRLLGSLPAGATAIYVLRNNILWWSGILWTSTPAGDNQGSVVWKLQGATWDSYLGHVICQHDFIVIGGDVLDVAREILADMQSDPLADIDLVPDTLESGQSVLGVTYYASGQSSYAKMLSDYSSQSPGFEWSSTTIQDATTGLRTRQLRFGYPLLALDLNYATGPAQISGARTHRLNRPGNIISYSYPMDATRGGTECSATGATITTTGTGSQPVLSTIHQAGDLLAAGYPRLSFTTSYSNVPGPFQSATQGQAVLEAHAAADLAAGRTPVTVPTVRVRLDRTDITPQSLGDTAVLEITDPAFPSPDGVAPGLLASRRIVGMKITAQDRSTPEYLDLVLN